MAQLMRRRQIENAFRDGETFRADLSPSPCFADVDAVADGLRLAQDPEHVVDFGVDRDEVYVEGCERGARDNVTELYDSPAMVADREQDAARLRAVMT